MNVYSCVNCSNVIETIKDIANEDELIKFCLDNKFHLNIALMSSNKHKTYRALCKPKLEKRRTSHHYKYDKATDITREIFILPQKLPMFHVKSGYVMAYGESLYLALIALMYKINDTGIYYP